MKTYLHLMNQSNIQVSKTYMRFCEEKFGNIKHVFCLKEGEKKKEDIGIFENVEVEVLRTLSEPLKRYKEYDKIFLHAMCITLRQQIYILIHPEILDKLYWIAWGIDLYEYRRKDNVVRILYTFFQTYFRKKIKYFVGIFPPDINYFTKYIGRRAKTYYGPYMTQLYSDMKEIEYNDNGEIELVSRRPIKIVVGHSATPVLRHIDVLKTLEKYSSKDIQIYIPLSYGIKAYGDEVESIANKIFGEKAICIREYKPYSEYLSMLKDMDIVIFNTSRQIGLGNIVIYMYLKKKIYMPEKSVMFQYFRKRGVPVLKCEDLESGSYEDLLQTVDMIPAKKLIEEEYFNKEFLGKCWGIIFD